MGTRIRGAMAVALAVVLSMTVTACGGSTTPQTPGGVVSTTAPTSGGTTPTTPLSPQISSTVEMPGTLATPTPTVPSMTASAAETTAEPAEQATAELPAEPPADSLDQSAAADALAPLFAAVEAADANLTAAADAVNGSFTGDTATFGQSTVDLIDRARPTAVADAIPAGLQPSLEQAVLLVYSDLFSRYASLHGESCVQVGTVPRSEIATDCFTAGHVAAARMTEDLAAARAATAGSTYAAPAADSPAVAEHLLRIAYINGNNEGCGSMGGHLAIEPIVIGWNATPTPDGPAVDGLVNDARFSASYSSGAGWAVNIFAC